jgi:hypothetical protein
VSDKFLTNLKVQDGFLNIPLEIDFDFEGRSQAVEEYESDILRQIINPVVDFEMTKFAHSGWTFNLPITVPPIFPGASPTVINVTLNPTTLDYEFYFFDYTTEVNLATISNWNDDYENATFTDSEIYYFANSFKGSFFKLDFYDKKDPQTQKILLTVILPTQQGIKETGFIGSPNNPITVQVQKPKFRLDYMGANKEGFFIYFLKDKSIFNLDSFYVSCKFFNAKIGQFVRMLNVPQSNFVGPGIFNVNKEDTFYYKYVLNYNNFKYAVYNESPNGSLSRVGTSINPIKWYEYVNP